MTITKSRIELKEVNGGGVIVRGDGGMAPRKLIGWETLIAAAFQPDRDLADAYRDLLVRAVNEAVAHDWRCLTIVAGMPTDGWREVRLALRFVSRGGMPVEYDLRTGPTHRADGADAARTEMVTWAKKQGINYGVITYDRATVEVHPTEGFTA